MLAPVNAQVVTEQLGRAKPVNPSNQADALPAAKAGASRIWKTVGRSEISMQIKTPLMLSASVEFVPGLALIPAPGLLANGLPPSGLGPGCQAVGRVGGFALV